MLNNLQNNKELGFEDIEEIKFKAAFGRVEKICDFFKDLQVQAKSKKMSKFMYEPVITNIQPV